MFVATPKMDKTAAGTMASAVSQAAGAEEETDVEEKSERNEKGDLHLAGSEHGKNGNLQEAPRQVAEAVMSSDD